MSDGTIDGVPFVAFSNAELAECPQVEAGDVIVCAHCGGTHTLEDSAPPSPLLFFMCGEKPYVAALKGALLFGHQVAEQADAEARC